MTIHRQEDFARDHWTLIRITSERARWPRQVVRAVYKMLKVNGYDGPEPEFNELWVGLSNECAPSPRIAELRWGVPAHSATLQVGLLP